MTERIRGRIGTAAVALAIAGVTVSCSPSPRRVEIQIRALAFPPTPTDLRPGDTLVWVNRDLVPHTVTAADGSWDSGELAPGDAFTLVIDEGAEVPYVCRYHPTMSGVVSLRGHVPSPPP